MEQIELLIEKISSLPKENKTLLIAIDGRGGSGKSTLAQKLKEKLSSVTIVHLDDFAYAKDAREKLLKQVILPLEKNKVASYRHYDWKIRKLMEQHKIKPGGIVIIEGVSTLHDLLCNHFDFKIWIECPAEIGLQRGAARELRELGRDTSKEWIEKYLPEEKEYIEKQHPQQKADYILDTSVIE